MIKSQSSFDGIRCETSSHFAMAGMVVILQPGRASGCMPTVSRRLLNALSIVSIVLPIDCLSSKVAASAATCCLPLSSPLLLFSLAFLLGLVDALEILL